MDLLVFGPERVVTVCEAFEVIQALIEENMDGTQTRADSMINVRKLSPYIQH